MCRKMRHFAKSVSNHSSRYRGSAVHKKKQLKSSRKSALPLPTQQAATPNPSSIQNGGQHLQSNKTPTTRPTQAADTPIMQTTALNNRRPARVTSAPARLRDDGMPSAAAGLGTTLPSPHPPLSSRSTNAFSRGQPLSRRSREATAGRTSSEHPKEKTQHARADCLAVVIGRLASPAKLPTVCHSW